jgi:hypothetical protein
MASREYKSAVVGYLRGDARDDVECAKLFSNLESNRDDVADRRGAEGKGSMRALNPPKRPERRCSAEAAAG